MFFFFKHKTAYEMRISDWSSDVFSSDLDRHQGVDRHDRQRQDHHADDRDRGERQDDVAVAGACARRVTGGRGEDRVDQRAHATPPFVYACTAPASPSRADRDEPATGPRTRPYGFATDIGCPWRVKRTRTEEHT